MNSFTRRIVGVVVAGLLLATTACGGGDGGSSKAPDGRSIEGLLRLMPEGSADTQVIVSLLGVAADAADLDIDGEPGEEQYEMERLAALTDPTGELAVLSPGLLRAARLPGDFDDLLFPPSALSVEIQIGDLPEMTTIALGDLDEEPISDAALEIDGVTRRDVEGTEVVSWLDDAEVDTTRSMPIGSIPSLAGRLAFPDAGMLVHTTNDADLGRTIDTIGGDAPSLADHDDLVAIASALDDAGAHAAFLSSRPMIALPDIGANKAENGTPEPRGALDPYTAIGVGPTFDDGEAGIVVVVTHEDAAAAEANVENMKQAIAKRSEGTGGNRQPYPFDELDIEARDAVLIARFTTEVPTMWIQLVVQRDELLTHN